MPNVEDRGTGLMVAKVVVRNLIVQVERMKTLMEMTTGTARYSWKNRSSSKIIIPLTEAGIVILISNHIFLPITITDGPKADSRA